MKRIPIAFAGRFIRKEGDAHTGETVPLPRRPGGHITTARNNLSSGRQWLPKRLRHKVTSS